MTFPLLIGGLALSPSFKEHESYVAQEIEELYCSDFGAVGMAAFGGTANFVSTGRVPLSAHPDTTVVCSDHFLLPPQAEPCFTKEQAETGRADEIPKAGWKKESYPAFTYVSIKLFPLSGS